MRLPVLIGLGVAIFVAALLGISESRRKSADAPATAENQRPVDTQAAREQAAEKETQAREAAEREARRLDDERQAAARQDQARIAAARKAEAERAEAERLQAERARQEAERAAAEKAEAAERAAAGKAEADRKEAERLALAARAQADEAAWDKARAGPADALKAYLQARPTGAHAAEAQAALDGLQKPPKPPQQAAAAAEEDEDDDVAPGLSARRDYKPRRYYYRSTSPPRSAENGGSRATAQSSRPAPPSLPPLPRTATPSAGAIQPPLPGSPAPPPQSGAPGGEQPPIRTTEHAAQTGTPPKTDGTADASMPLFPRNPPRASTRYEIPDEVFASMKTYGEATKFILAALESSGYVERAFFSTEAGGVAMVTRLERINEDGTSAAAPVRWAAKLPPDGAVAKTLSFLSGLFFVEKGRYRTIVFMLQDQPFTQGDRPASETQARRWLSSGANVISPKTGAKPYSGAHCTALVYEFASDGAAVKLVESGLTARDHLSKSGLLAALEPAR